jgi:hypothetical protein
LFAHRQFVPDFARDMRRFPLFCAEEFDKIWIVLNYQPARAVNDRILRGRAGSIAQSVWHWIT